MRNNLAILKFKEWRLIGYHVSGDSGNPVRQRHRAECRETGKIFKSRFGKM
jgi:hypothetical protein